MSAQDRGWGSPGCSSWQLTRVTYPGMIDTPPFFPLNVRREVAPLFRELVAWLVRERTRLGLPPLTCSGGYNKRLIRGSKTQWSNHSWGLAADFSVATNPMQSPLRTDMPPGTSAKARSLGLEWGGDWQKRPDPMHFEFTGTPDDARRHVANLRITTASAPKIAPAPPPAPLPSPEGPMYQLLETVDSKRLYAYAPGQMVHIPDPDRFYDMCATGSFPSQTAPDGKVSSNDVFQVQVDRTAAVIGARS